MKITKVAETGVAGRMAGHAPASGVNVTDPGGVFGGLDDLQAILEAWAAGTLGAYLTTAGGGKGIPFDLDPMGSAKTVDWANGNLGYGELTEACAVTTVGWTNGRDCWTALELTGGAAGPHLPTIAGVTWKTDAPVAVATGDVSHILLHSRDGGTTIWGWVSNGGGGNPIEVLDEGVSLTADLTSLDFVGAGVIATAVGDAVTVTINASAPADDTHVWMPLTTVVGGVPELVWDADNSLIPTLVPI